MVVPTHNGLGLSVGIRSIRAKELLFDLHREEFSHFVQPKPTMDKNGMWTASFCFRYRPRVRRTTFDNPADTVRRN